MKAPEVESFDDDLLRLVERMTSLMHEAQGVGLAATQVGVLGDSSSSSTRTKTGSS